MNTKNQSRSSNFELMRTVAMIMVTMLHALGHGGVLEQYEFGSAGYIFMWFIETLSYVSVNIFVLITGYFMVNSTYKPSKIIKLIVQVEFYSLICLLIAKLVLHQQLNIEDIVRAIFPITGKIYWFASAYAVLITLSPLLNKFIRSMGKKEHFFTCILLCVIFCIIPTFLFWSRSVLSGGSDFIWFIVLYLTASYIRLYGNDTSFLEYSKGKYLAIYFVFCVLGVLSRLIIGKAGIILFGKPLFESMLYSYNSIIIFVASVNLFMFFKFIEIRNKFLSKLVIFTGSVCFGTYLYSDNPFLRKPLWDFVNLPKLVENASWGAALIIAYVLIIFLIGCLIEWLRSSIFSIVGISKLINKLDTLAEK